MKVSKTVETLPSGQCPLGSFRMHECGGIPLAMLKTTLKHYEKSVEKRKNMFFEFFDGAPGKIVDLA